MSRLILASQSPQRKTLLAGLGLEFEVLPSSVSEDDYLESDPLKRSKDLARLKAEDIARKNPDAYVIGCDTLVVAEDGTLLEKPFSAEEARTMIRRQSNATSIVHSALCIADPSGVFHEGISSSLVKFKALSEEEIEWWISTRLWEGRSGAFQIDGKGQLMISQIDGDWSGIVGLPVHLLGTLLTESGMNLLV